MKQTKIDSVQNFLTPSKLLSTKMGHQKKPKTNYSMHEGSNPVATSNDGNSMLPSPNSERKER